MTGRAFSIAAAVLWAVAAIVFGCATASAETPDPTDFHLEVIVTGKQCFGPASCVYKYFVDPWPTASFPPQPTGADLTMIYTVTGGDQDQIGNFRIDYQNDHQELYRDKDATVIGPDGATFTATVTRVIVATSGQQ